VREGGGKFWLGCLVVGGGIAVAFHHASHHVGLGPNGLMFMVASLL